MTDVNQKTVIVAIDNRLENMRLSVLLRRLDYYVFTAFECEDVVHKIEYYEPNAVVMSFRNEGFVNTSCLEHIRSKKQFAGIPFVFVGSRSDEGEMKKWLRKGADAYLLCPVNPTSLYITVQKLTEDRPRDNLRAKIIFKVVVSGPDFKRLTYASTLSEKGVFIRTTNPIPVGTKVALSMDLPSPKPVELEGIVIYAVALDRGYFIEPGICIKFTNADEKTRSGLRKFIEDELTYDLDPHIDM